ncbi:MAG: flagellar hook-associated protein FlgL [Burkholderiales bacterium]|nr:flagellar hook-associated protein FlgL [Burkholderiales bacterium]
MVRISTMYAFQRSLDAMNDRRTSLLGVQEQMATGKRLNSPSDDPVNAAMAERTRAQVARIELERRMMNHASGMLAQAENAMGNAGEVLQLVREKLVAAGSTTLSPQDRALIGQQVRQLRDELLSIANLRDGAGGYVFGGQGTADAPFTSAATPTFGPNAGEQSTGTDLSFTTVQDGRAIFQDLSAGGTPQSIFKTLDDVTALLEDTSAPSDTVIAGVQTAMSGVDNAMERLLLKRTQAGEQLRALESRASLLETGELQARGQLSDLVDLDYAAAISQFQNEQTALNAAMSTYAQISRMSLFDYLR